MTVERFLSVGLLEETASKLAGHKHTLFMLIGSGTSVPARWPLQRGHGQNRNGEERWRAGFMVLCLHALRYVQKMRHNSLISYDGGVKSWRFSAAVFAASS